MKYVKLEENESDILTKNTTEKLLKGHAENIRNGTVKAWRQYDKTVETVAAAWRENVKNETVTEETDESWTKVCRRQTNMKSSLHKSKYKGNGG